MTATDLEELKVLYGLGAGFELNDFENWVPAHAKCNQHKNDDIYDAPAMIHIFARVAKVAKLSREVSTKVEKDRSKGRLIGRLLSALDAKAVSKAEILALLEGVLPEEKAAKEEPLRIAPEWQVVRTDAGIEVVKRDQQVGIRPTAKNPDVSWICPTCGSMGPWNGVICLTCGMKSDPSD